MATLATFGAPLALAVGAAGVLGLLPVALDHVSGREDRLKGEGAALLYHVRHASSLHPEESLAEIEEHAHRGWPYY